MMRRNFKYRTFYVYATLMLLISIYSFKKAEYNWDMLPYMAVILQHDGNTNIEKIHSEVYTIAKLSVAEPVFIKLIDSTSAYRRSVSANAAAFNQQLPFYVVKPLYTRFCYLFYKCGMSLPGATALPSVISFFLVSLLLYIWIGKYLPQVPAFIFSMLLMLSPFMLEAAKLSTPDLFSALLLLAGIYSYVEMKNHGLAALVLLLAIFARLDNIIPVTLISLVAFYIENRRGNFSVMKYIAFSITAIASYLLVSWQAGGFGWSIFYYPDFATHLNPYYDINRPFSFSGYFALVKSQLMMGLYYSSLMIFVFLGYFFIWFSKPNGGKDVAVESLLTITVLATIIIRFILQPVIADRFYVAYYLMVSVFVLKKYALVRAGMNQYMAIRAQ
jgi:hypothetical protein